MYTNCAYLVTLYKIQPVPVGQYAKAHLLLFVSSRLALKVTKHYTRKEIHLASFHACQATVQENVPPCARMRAAALGLDGPPPPWRAAARRVLFQEQWLWRGVAWRGMARQLWWL